MAPAGPVTAKLPSMHQGIPDVKIKQLGQTDYEPVWQAMKSFTQDRTADTPDECWVTEHQPVFTLGLAGDPTHLLQAGDIPLVACDRGGQITYHGPGQLVVYPLLDLRRLGLKVREYVQLLEECIILTLTDCGIAGAQRRPNAPGVYLRQTGTSNDSDNAAWEKIAALGIKIKNGCTYHGLSLNVAMDLSPFEWINPCGYAGLRTTDMQTAGARIPLSTVSSTLIQHLQTLLAHARSAA